VLHVGATLHIFSLRLSLLVAADPSLLSSVASHDSTTLSDSLIYRDVLSPLRWMTSLLPGTGLDGASWWRLASGGLGMSSSAGRR